MPKLNKKQAKAVSEAESGSFLLEPGRYAGRLKSVTEREGREYPQWSWEFEALHDEDGKRKAGRQWVNTSLSPKAAWKVKEVFEALGYTTDSDTDEMIGEWAVLTVTQEIAEQGKYQGQTVNRVQTVAEFDPDDWPFDPDEVEATTGSSDGDGDDF